LGDWAYGIAFTDSEERAAALPAWLRYYNEERPHSALKMRPSASRVAAVNDPENLYI
jgi:transposase InsO family protein